MLTQDLKAIEKMLSEREVENKIQEQEISEVMDIIHIQGGMVPKLCDAST